MWTGFILHKYSDTYVTVYAETDHSPQNIEIQFFISFSCRTFANNENVFLFSKKTYCSRVIWHYVWYSLKCRFWEMSVSDSVFVLRYACVCVSSLFSMVTFYLLFQLPWTVDLFMYHVYIQVIHVHMHVNWKTMNISKPELIRISEGSD